MCRVPNRSIQGGRVHCSIDLKSNFNTHNPYTTTRCVLSPPIQVSILIHSTRGQRTGKKTEPYRLVRAVHPSKSVKFSDSIVPNSKELRSLRIEATEATDELAIANGFEKNGKKREEYDRSRVTSESPYRFDVVPSQKTPASTTAALASKLNKMDMRLMALVVCLSSAASFSIRLLL